MMSCEFLSWCSLEPAVQAAWVQAVGSIVAVLVAIGVAAWQSKKARDQITQQREIDHDHRRRMTRPLLSIERLVQKDTPRVRLFVRNMGLGPAIIRSVNVYVDGENMRFDPRIFWQEVLGCLGLPQGVMSGGTVFAEGSAIQAGGKRKLLQYQPQPDQSIDNEKLQSAFDKLRIEIEYCSIYDEAFALGHVDDPSLASFDLGAADDPS